MSRLNQISSSQVNGDSCTESILNNKASLKRVEGTLSQSVLIFTLTLLCCLTFLIRPTWTLSLSPGFDFIEAIQDVDTVAPAHLLNLNSLVISEMDSELVEMKYGYEDWIWNQYTQDQPSLIQTTDFLLDCGREDKCPIPNDESDIASSSHDYLTQSRSIDYKIKPFLCRCDAECHKYGDCCWNMTVGFPLRNESNLWSCKFIHGKVWAMMVSRCNSDWGINFLSQMCMATLESIPTKNYTYLIDIPVYSRTSSTFYRNIYCARCHGEKNPDLIHWKTRLHCNEAMSSVEQKIFLEKAEYYPGERYFQMDNRTCAIYISELYNTTIPLETTIPNIRYCGESVDSCLPPGPGPGHDDSDIDTYTTSLLLEDTRFCSSYTQHVTTSDRRIFKNPHCARCNRVAMESTNDTVTSLKCYYGPAPFSIFKHVAMSPPKGPPQGLNLLFDFSLDSDEVLVGYEMLCSDNEIWDYIHRRCMMAICQKGYYLQNDACHPMLVAIEQTDHHQNSSGSLKGHENSLDDPINSTCMRILVFEYDYSFVSANNTSIIINASIMGDADHPIIFHPDEYEYWNETTLAICAKDLHEGFINRFSSVLNYMSTVSLAISVIFSFIHILLYLILPKLRNSPGRNLFCLTVSLFVSQLIFLTLINHSKWKVVCVAASITMHYMFLAAFFWMSVMSFDIWRTFSGAVVLSRNQSAEGKQLTFLKYNLFAWLTPLVIVSAALLVEFLPENFESNPSFMDHSENFIVEMLNKIKPSYGQNGFCWFGQRLSLFIFFAVPVALVITSNLILFSLTAKAILFQHKEAGKVLQNQESKVACAKKSSNTSGTSKESHLDEVRVQLYAKLALIMGLTWILGFISNFPKCEWLWYPFVILNGLQGTFIFFAFDFKWKILKMLKDRYARCCQDKSQAQRLARRIDSGHGTISTSASVSYSRTMSTSIESKST